MMSIRRVFAVAAIPFVIDTFAFVAPNQANAEAPRDGVSRSWMFGTVTHWVSIRT